HKELVEELLKDGINSRQGEWTESIAVGSEFFIEEIKEKLNVRAKGRKTIAAERAS
ncbi:MAG: transposase, partial [Deltaproteobacteria bacterium]|nr:transposase [Deltaproteobacteria bacterium]